MSDASIHFDGLNLVCADLEATVAFYQLLGVDIPEESVWRTASGAHHTHGLAFDSGDIDLDSPKLADVYNKGHRTGESTSNCVFGFRVGSRERVDAVHHEMVDAGHPSRQEPFDAFWGARYAIVADPDGRDVGIMSPSEDSRRSAGPDL